MFVFLTSRRALLAAAAAAAGIATVPGLAEELSPRDFLAGIYDAYVGKNGNGITLDSEQALRRYFEPALAAMIRRDQKEAEARGEAPNLDFDPFVDAQDWDIAAYTIAVTEAGSGKAHATVTFNNANKPTTVAIELGRIGGTWKITDITWPRDDKPGTLRQLFSR